MSVNKTVKKSAKRKEKSLLAQVFDIAFIFVLAFVCLVVPTTLQGAVLVSWEEGGAGIGFVWDPIGYFSLMLLIVGFFALILFHSVRNYRV
ncbi:TPA: efflux RND transporter permease subunit [Methanosarcinaceae archaeon]|nr:efflux RND transporter permease subunit [Methanosarcinaceae archaeon]